MQNIDQEILARISNAQIDLIQNTRYYTVLTMFAVAAFVYYIMLKYELTTLKYWFAYMILVDSYRIFVAYKYFQEKKSDTINFSNAYRNIIFGSFLSGVGWGASAIILVPYIEVIDILLITLVLSGISAGATTTLAYKRVPAYIFIVFLVFPFFYSLTMSPLVMDVLYVPLFIYLLFLVKNTTVFYNNNKQLLLLEFTGLEREEELVKERERAIQANSAKSMFLANMSHELRTPMHAILGFSSLGSNKVGTATKEKIASYFLRINESGQRLLYLLNDLLDLSKLEAGRMEFDLTEHDLQASLKIIADELAPLFAERCLTVDIEPSSVNTHAIYDNEKIEQVIRNLLSNAIKYTPDGMSVLIYFEETLLPCKEDSSEETAIPAISVSIMDQGTGVPEDELETVFEKFVQSSTTETGAGGTGLGLSISKEIIEGHGGSISACNSTKGGGAIFTFVIPRDRPDNQ